ncbi:hypothetical protein I3760_06G039400 [Carya illinoinensis]|nr:hypothetical protein I3760_06G039400 [Carya illinoinensis]
MLQARREKTKNREHANVVAGTNVGVKKADHAEAGKEDIFFFTSNFSFSFCTRGRWPFFSSLALYIWGGRRPSSAFFFYFSSFTFFFSSFRSAGRHLFHSRQRFLLVFFFFFGTRDSLAIIFFQFFFFFFFYRLDGGFFFFIFLVSFTFWLGQHFHFHC